MADKRFKLWDLPTRIFHWSLVACVLAAIVSGQIGGGWIDWHGRIGIAIAGLVTFRLAWGLIGSTYARFSHFFPVPANIRNYLQGEWQGEGHNPLGALSVLGLIGLLTVQVGTGLFSNDDIAFVGPLFELVSKDVSDTLSGFHKMLADGLIGLIVLHLLAIAFYGHVKKQNLVRPMVTGWKEGEGESARGGGFLAFCLALLVALMVVYGASGEWMPAPPPPPPAASTPSW